MAKHLAKFTQPFRDSPITFALAELLTNGSGEMVDLVCRFLNPAAAALLGLSPEEVQGRRLSQLGPERALEQLAPMQAVAFSGSSASFPYVTAGGQTLTVTCYQVMYGTVADVYKRQVLMLWQREPLKVEHLLLIRSNIIHCPALQS